MTWEMAERFQLGFSPDEGPGDRAARAGASSPTRAATRPASRAAAARGPVDRSPGGRSSRSATPAAAPIAFARPADAAATSRREVREHAREPALQEEPHRSTACTSRARRSPREQAIVVEGYTDVIGLHAAGYDDAVASMGTALTEQQLRELRKPGRATSCCCFDADAAGRRPPCAAWSSPRAPSRPAGAHRRCRRAARSGRHPGARPRGLRGRPAPRAAVLAFRIGLRARPRRRRSRRPTRPTRRVAGIIATRRLTPERDEQVRLVSSALRLALRLRGAARRARAPRRRRRECPRPPSRTHGRDQRQRALLLRSRSRAASACRRARGLTRRRSAAELRAAHAWVAHG